MTSDNTHTESANSSPDASSDNGRNSEPAFSIVDLVDAFTALRHEYRGQNRENRQLVEAIQNAAATIEAASHGASNGPSTQAGSSGKDAAIVLADTDHLVTRAIDSIERAEQSRQQQASARYEAAKRRYESSSRWTRWLAGSFVESVLADLETSSQASLSSSIEGLSLVRDRVRVSMRDLGLERVDTIDLDFDAQYMRAIGTVETTDVPPGQVIEQVSPCYRWRGDLLRNAEVRVSTKPNQ